MDTDPVPIYKLKLSFPKSRNLFEKEPDDILYLNGSIEIQFIPFSSPI